MNESCDWEPIAQVDMGNKAGLRTQPVGAQPYTD